MTKNVRYYLSYGTLLHNNYTLLENHTRIGYTIDLIKKHKTLPLKTMMCNYDTKNFIIYRKVIIHHQWKCLEKTATHTNKHHMKTKTIHEDTLFVSSKMSFDEYKQ